LLKTKVRGLTLVEVLVVLVVVIVLVVVLLPSARHERMGAMLNCVNNLKQIGLGLKIYADDNGERFPLQVSGTNNTPNPLYGGNKVSLYFQVVSNELGNAPRIVLCPFDEGRAPAKNFQTLAVSNISYFFNADATRNSSAGSVLSGDRFLKFAGQPAGSGIFLVTTNMKTTWTSGEHCGGGNILWADGSVQQTTTPALKTIIQNQPFSTNRFLMP
jgi:prepilin-type processing-associated H-X9-DG protein